jgi:hypothetical protein
LAKAELLFELLQGMGLIDEGLESVLCLATDDLSHEAVAVSLQTLQMSETCLIKAWSLKLA